MRIFIFENIISFIARWFFGAAEDLMNRTPVRWGGREYILEPRT